LKQKKPTPTAEIYFQATARLKHYMLFPFFEIEEMEIDLSLSNLWHTNMNDVSRSSYRILKQQSIVFQTTDIQREDWMYLTTSTPFEWYQRTVAIKHWSLSNTMEHICRNMHKKQFPVEIFCYDKRIPLEIVFYAN